MKLDFFKTTFLISVLTMSVPVPCNKETDVIIEPGTLDFPFSSGLPVDVMPPAFHIQESEKLVIPASIDLPANLPNGNKRVATYYAEGVQQYKAVQVGIDPVSYAWSFVGPKADLFDVSNKKVGSHGAGPHWQISPADSIFAQAYNPPKTAPSPDVNSIDWLLLMPKVGKPASGIFQNVAYIQRIATVGGKAPSVPPTSLNQTADVPYTAIYRFSSIR